MFIKLHHTVWEGRWKTGGSEKAQISCPHYVLWNAGRPITLYLCLCRWSLKILSAKTKKFRLKNVCCPFLLGKSKRDNKALIMIQFAYIIGMLGLQEASSSCNGSRTNCLHIACVMMTSRIGSNVSLENRSHQILGVHARYLLSQWNVKQNRQYFHVNSACRYLIYRIERCTCAML